MSGDLDRLLDELEPWSRLSLGPGIAPAIHAGVSHRTADNVSPTPEELRDWLCSFPGVDADRLTRSFKTHIHDHRGTVQLVYQAEPLHIDITRPGTPPPFAGTRAHLDLLLAHANSQLVFTPGRPPDLVCRDHTIPLDNEAWREEQIEQFLASLCGQVVVGENHSFKHRDTCIEFSRQGNSAKLWAKDWPLEAYPLDVTLAEFCLDAFFRLGLERLELRPGLAPRGYVGDQWAPMAAGLLTQRHCEQLVADALTDELKQRLTEEGRLQLDLRLLGFAISLDARLPAEGWFEVDLHLNRPEARDELVNRP